jgi:hypothetical protein
MMEGGEGGAVVALSLIASSNPAQSVDVYPLQGPISRPRGRIEFLKNVSLRSSKTPKGLTRYN